MHFYGNTWTKTTDTSENPKVRAGDANRREASRLSSSRLVSIAALPSNLGSIPIVIFKISQRLEKVRNLVVFDLAAVP